MKKITLYEIRQFFSKFLHLRRMEEENVLLDYTKFNPERTLVVDVDGTILNAIDRDYENAVEIPDVIEKLNVLHDQGWTVIYFTARGQLSKNGNMEIIERENRPVLERWLKKHGVKYDYLFFNKIYGSFYIDDKALDVPTFLQKNFF